MIYVNELQSNLTFGACHFSVLRALGVLISRCNVEFGGIACYGKKHALLPFTKPLQDMVLLIPILQARIVILK